MLFKTFNRYIAAIILESSASFCTSGGRPPKIILAQPNSKGHRQNRRLISAEPDEWMLLRPVSGVVRTLL
jgi:hypothetical protein